MPNVELHETVESRNGNGQAESIATWVERTIAAAPNKERLGLQLDSIRDEEAMVRFVHRFVLFNDALAARVPFLAGVIHLTPGLFLDPEAHDDFSRQAN